MFERIWVVVKDEDDKVFNVRGPTLDDTALTNEVCKAQEQGRQISCFTAPLTNERDRKQLIAICTRDLGLTYTDRSII